MPTPDDSGPHQPHDARVAARPVEPEEDSADDPIPHDMDGGTATDEELDAAEKAEPPALGELTPEEQAYRWDRLADRTIGPRIRRRFAKRVVDESMLDDLEQETYLRARGYPTFPSPTDAMFPWIYKPGSASRKKAIRAHQRREKREVSLDHVDESRHAPPPEIDPIPDGLERHAAILEQLTADDTGKRKLEMLKRHLLHDEPMAAIAQDNGMTTEAAYQQQWRFVQKLRKALLNPSFIAFVLVGLISVPYIRDHLEPAKMVEEPYEIQPREPRMSEGDRAVLAIAEKAKEEGLKACAEQNWGMCASRLNTAKATDSRLEDDPQVMKAAAAAATALQQQLDEEKKTVPDPGKAP